jgi:4'-phosphopantetheinyl transferase
VHPLSVEVLSPGVEASPSVLDLEHSAIHLWLGFPDTLDVMSLQRCRDILSPDERRREHRFHFPLDQRCYLITRALVRRVLSRYVSIPPEGWVFGTTSHGRPEILNRDSGARDLVFNISHNRDLIVVGVTSRPTLGVDVENTCERAAPLEIAGRYFAPNEASALRELPREGRAMRFWEYWTFKESYIKARGMGLSLPLDKFNFRFPDERSVDIDIDTALADDPKSWEFWQFRPTPHHLVALCATRAPACREPPVVRQMVPFASERIVPTVFSRRSPSLILEGVER